MTDSSVIPSAAKSPAATQIVIIDDDERLNALLKEYLSRFNFSLRAYALPREGLRALKTETPDLVILDIMLPEMDGLSVCRKIREDSRVPIIMLTARGDVADRIVGLEMGADDYLPKPFEPRELVARIEAVLRRGAAAAVDLLRVGELEINGTTCCASLQKKPLPLTTAEFSLLSLLARNCGRVMTRERIMDEIKGIDWDVYDRSIDVLVSRVRQKLDDDPRQPRFIRTVRGIGYSFIGETQ